MKQSLLVAALLAFALSACSKEEPAAPVEAPVVEAPVEAPAPEAAPADMSAPAEMSAPAADESAPAAS